MDAVTLPPERLAGLPPAVVAFVQALVAENAGLRAVNVALTARVAELEAKIKQNSTNSSKPPSSDPPSVKRAPPKPASGKKAGGQPGHPKHERALVERPDHTHECKPTSSRPTRWTCASSSAACTRPRCSSVGSGGPSARGRPAAAAHAVRHPGRRACGEVRQPGHVLRDR